MRLDIRWGTTAAALVLTMLLGAPACAAAHGRAYARVGPPAPIVEVRPVAPGPRHIWIGGHYQWVGSRYVWTSGRWAVPPRARATWVPGHWAHDRRGWHFVEGHWR
jgi:YXWGXW repeat-containing protein